MPATERVAVAVSGGMDSLLALALIREQKYETVAVHGLFLPEDGQDAAYLDGLREQCRNLDVQLHVLDLRDAFRKCVSNVFAAEYLAGQTPNPCSLCNSRIKFGVLLDKAADFGATLLATGHYARLGRDGQGRSMLLRGTDAAKDQSYFLSLLPWSRLDRALFPLGELHKQDVPAELARRGLTPPLSKESQEICFIPNDDYRAWLEAQQLRLPGAGPMLLADGTRVGTHQGLWRYTQGQRRGLGVAWSEPLYVVDKDVARNALVLGVRDELLCTGCEVEAVNLLSDPAHWPEEVLARTRYRQRALPARAALEEGRLCLKFSQPCDRPAPGQVATLYDALGRVLAGGIIRRITVAE